MLLELYSCSAHVWCEHFHVHVKGHTTNAVCIEFLKLCKHFYVHVKGHTTNAVCIGVLKSDIICCYGYPCDGSIDV